MPSISRIQNDPLINRKIKVGTFEVPITVTNPRNGASVTVRALVDTGATLTILPASVLRGLGVESIRRQAFEMADGRMVEFDLGRIEVTVEGRPTPTLGIFGPEGVSATLGVVVLETAGLSIDPVHLRLIPVPGLV